METQISIHNEGIPDTHYFSYKNKLYPIKYDFFKYASEYFQNNEDEIKSNKILQLIEQDPDSDPNISENSIRNFIDFVQNKSIILTDQNVSELNFLSKKYIIRTLMNFTEQYIEKNHENLILPILLVRQHDTQFETEIYEEILSNHLLDYINDEQLLNLKFNILYRIINNFLSVNKEYTKVNSNTEFIEFLFKCLDKYGQKASVLFNQIDLNNSGTNYLARLMRDYSNIFDFHFVNSEFIKSLYQTESNLIQKICEYENIKNKNSQTIQKLEKEIQEMKKEFSQELSNQRELYEQSESQHKTNFQEIKNEINEMKNLHTSQLNQQKENLSQNEKETQGIRDEISQMKISFSKDLTDQKQSYYQNESQQKIVNLNSQQEMNDIKKQIAEMKSLYSNELIEQKKLNSLYDNQQNIINQIGIDLSTIKKEQAEEVSKTNKNEIQINDIKNELNQIKEKIENFKTQSNSCESRYQKLIAQRQQLRSNNTKAQSPNKQFISNSKTGLSRSLPSNNNTSPYVEPICTYEATGETYIIQKEYHCRTCNLTGNLGMCEVCARVCHKDHDIYCDGIRYSFFCDCPVETSCKCGSKTDMECTSITFGQKPINQPMYNCTSCSKSFICQYCAIKLHHGHKLRYLGIVNDKVCSNASESLTMVTKPNNLISSLC